MYALFFSDHSTQKRALSSTHDVQSSHKQSVHNRMLTYGKVWDIYMQSKRNITTTASKLLEIHGPCLGSLESLKSKIRRILAKRPHKIEMRETWREQLLFADEAVPSKRTVHSIMQPKIDELLGFAEEQGVSYDEVLDLLKEKKNKKQRSVTDRRAQRQKPQVRRPMQAARPHSRRPQ